MIYRKKIIGIQGYGSKAWIAGTLYIQSLLHGNRLQDEDSRDTTYLFLHQEDQSLEDYQEVKGSVKEILFFSYYFGAKFSFVVRYLTAAKRLIRGKYPLFPPNNLPAMLREKQIDVIFPANSLLSRKYSSATLICWIPDFQHIYLPENFTYLERLRRNLSFRRMVKVADKVVVSNQYSYEDACRLAPEAKKKFAVLPFCMHLGPAWRQPDPQQYRQQYDLPVDYLMFPSQCWKHKNHLALFKAIYQLKQKGKVVTLVCTGHFGDPRFPDYGVQLRKFIKDHALDEQIRVLGLLPRTHQVQLMRGARAIVQPSLFEGWSALLEDCRSLGKTVFVSDIPMHLEQQPDHAIFFDPHSPEQLAELILHHWDSLPTGVDVVREQAGEEKNREGLKNFAIRFNEICGSVTETVPL